MKRKRVLLAGLFHETHTFIAGRTTLADFTVARGQKILAKAGDGSPTAGFLEVAQAAGWEVVPTIDLRCTPSAMVEDAVPELFWAEFAAAAQNEISRGLDAVFLILHGAMAAASEPDVEGALLARLRKLPGFATIPVFAVLDLHANVTARMAKHANALIAYRENPHTDAHETAVRAAQLLRRCLETGSVPQTHWRRAPIIWAPPGTGTAQDPMRGLNAMARALEADDAWVWEMSVTPGFSFADTPETGLSFSLVTMAPAAEAQRMLTKFCREAWRWREAGVVAYPGVETVLKQILPVQAGPVLLVEPADNIGGGAPGDGTGILRGLLKFDVPDSAVIINDPANVTAAVAAGVGAKLTLAIGGRGSALDAGPVDLMVEVISRSDGHFELEDIHSHLASMRGRHIAMGPCAVVRHRGITILLTSNKTPPFDLGQWRSQGIAPEKLKVIGVKAAVAHRRAYDPIIAASYFVETPGPCSSQVNSFKFHHLNRPVWPLDPALEWPDGRV
jgi:microcystin degradation protein MlrC